MSLEKVDISNIASKKPSKYYISSAPFRAPLHAISRKYG